MDFKKNRHDVEIIEGNEIQLIQNEENISRADRLMLEYEIPENTTFYLTKELTGRNNPEKHRYSGMSAADAKYLHYIGRVFIRQVQKEHPGSFCKWKSKSW